MNTNGWSNESKQELKRRYLEQANQAKDRMAMIAQELEEAGFHRKAQSAMTIVYQIEAWQHRN